MQRERDVLIRPLLTLLATNWTDWLNWLLERSRRDERMRVESGASRRLQGYYIDHEKCLSENKTSILW